MQWQDWGTVPYRDAWTRQTALRAARQQGAISDQLICCEHPRVITSGRRDCADDWKLPKAAVAAQGIEIVESDRGGKLTYHGPGQLVVYWIVDITARRIGIREFVQQIERVIVSTLATCGIAATGDPEHPGVWVGHNKIAALGLHVQHGVTQHGCAINYAVDLHDYAFIVPCGIADRGVTSLDREGCAIERMTLRDRLLQTAAAEFGEPIPQVTI